MTITVIPGAQTLAITDIITSDPNEPRIRDLRLAEALGMANTHAIRRIITRHLDTLKGLGGMVSHPDAKPPTGGRPSCSYYLTKRQALFITTKANTATAAMVTVQMVDLFDAVTSNPRVMDVSGQVLSLSEPEIMVALAFRRQVQATVAAQVEGAIAARRHELGATASIAVTQILTGTLTYDIDSKRFTQRDAVTGKPIGGPP